ncbi:2-oxoglutarate and iron-dependent oxygenase domain-containing protein [Thermopolyspora sp. NPDC052614]|uniref:isopenicillin N synthase family dioxygenase n=1 Tax=Thermopolyspora sp. NPDC052614 TaxID=3155682 RepID=UPI0034391336
MTGPEQTVPVIDLMPWLFGDAADRASVARRVDAALREWGFMLITGHHVSADTRAEIRRHVRRFFALPEQVKRRYAVTIGGRGWLPPGAEANGYAEGTPTLPDLKETFAVGADRPIGDPEFDPVWFLPNVWPAEIPELKPLVEGYLAEMRLLSDELLVLCAAALGLAPDYFTRHTTTPSYTMNINWYPPLSMLGEPEPGQYRIGPHTDFGTVTVLDRQDGVGCLQVCTPDGEWVNAPYVEGAFTINIGDLLARWTGGRWRSNRHRVLPPDPGAPDEELISLIYFYELNPDTIVEPVPGGPVAYEPVRANDYLLDKLNAITVG